VFPRRLSAKKKKKKQKANNSKHMNDSFQKIIRLIEKTGDKCIILNQNGEDAYVVMALKDYEGFIDSASGLKNLSEEEFLEKINRDIAIWRSAQENENFAEWENTISQKISRKNEFEPPEKEVIEPKDDTYYFEPLD